MQDKRKIAFARALLVIALLLVSQQTLQTAIGQSQNTPPFNYRITRRKKIPSRGLPIKYC